MEKTLENLLETSKNNRSLHPNDIPELDLYMDQVIALMRAYLEGTDDKEPLTRTMIHNYSKAGLILPVKGKKYTKEHILQMLVIYSLKNTLSIAQIKHILSWMRAQEDSGEAQLSQCFEAQLSRRSVVNAQLTEDMDRMMQESGMSTDTPADVLSFLLTLTDITDTLTRFASAVTQHYFQQQTGDPKNK